MQTVMRDPVRLPSSGTSLSAPYAMPGTDLRRVQLLPGVVVDRKVITRHLLSGTGLRSCYAKPGTAVAEGAMGLCSKCILIWPTRSLVLT
eukprot:256-Rhodomonas_salina.2